MAATAISRCADGCGRVVVHSSQITLAIWPEVPGMSTYSFRCPNCMRIQTWQAMGVTQSLLVNAGTPTKVMRLPEQRSGVREDVEPLTADSLIDLGLTLRETDTLTELLEGEEG